MTTLHAKAARIIEAVVGLYYLAGALPKVADINRFSVQMSAYHVIEDRQLLPVFGCVTIFAEFAVGMALVLGLRLRGLTYAVYHGMLVVFSALIVYAWTFHGLEDCGCFPLIAMTPQVSLMKNLVLVLLGAYSGWVLSGPGSALRRPPLCGPGMLPRFAVALTVSVLATAYAWATVDRLDTGTGGEGEATGPFAAFQIETPEGVFDLGKGVYLVPIMSMTCEECMAKVPGINDLMQVPGMPPVVALCFEEEAGEMEKFQNDTLPLFPMHSLIGRPLVYYSLRGEDSFRLSLVSGGRAVAVWDGKLPTLDELMPLVEKENAAGG
ncbi:MAG TPA: hypothetical protein PKL54_00085 [Candidatus Hydrogenedentes bacterium]|nr:hypothetical protein [Candidatus Hydrogenedentota bacterium]HOC71179.1 hypothetical protein [Candidatus Hydrogenedentota bacterium]